MASPLVKLFGRRGLVRGCHRGLGFGAGVPAVGVHLWRCAGWFPCPSGSPGGVGAFGLINRR